MSASSPPAGVPGLATAEVDGVPLDRCEPMPWPVAAAVLAPVAEALGALHARGWVHGDVSPANVVVGSDGAGVLVDLDRSAAFGAAGATGTPGWAAPEVAAGGVVTPAAEVWSLAAVALGAVTGASPTTGAPVPPEAALAVRRALTADPASRPTAAELAAGLRVAAAAAPPLLAARPVEPRDAVTTDFGPRPPAPPVAPPAPTRRAGPVAAVVVAVAAVAWWATRPGDGGDERAVGPCPAIPAGAAIVGDPDGDGCVTAADWHAGVLRIALAPDAEPVRVAVGAASDAVVLGDWDCDGRDTPGAYRPSTGVVTLWDAWPTSATPVAPTRTEQHEASGTARVGRRGGCDHVEVAPAESAPALASG